VERCFWGVWAVREEGEVMRRGDRWGRLRVGLVRVVERGTERNIVIGLVRFL